MKFKVTSFIEGIITLLISQIFIKIFGVAYSLYMTNKSGFGDTGNAIYMSGYQIYALFLTISSIGVPNSISKLISEKDSMKDYQNANRIFYIALLLFTIIGFIGCIFLFTFSGIIAQKLLLIPEAKLSLKILSPAIVFVSISSVIRGYCNGEKNISITAKSQFFEQVLKSVFTIFFVEIVSRLSNNNVELMVASANGATTVATFISMIYIIIKYKRTHERKINLRFNTNSKTSLKINVSYKEDLNQYKYSFQKDKITIILKNIIKISLPIAISALLTSFSKNIDSVTVVRILKKYMSESEAIKKYGIISSKVDVLIAFPLSFNTAITTALVPEIARRKARNDIIGIDKKIKSSIYINIMIGIPATIGMFFYSKEIFLLLFPNAFRGEELLKIASVCILFSSLSQTFAGILQGLGKNNIPVYATFFGIVGKIMCNFIFVNIKGIYEKGAIIGNIFLSVIIFLIEFICLKKYINTSFNIIKSGIIPVFFSVIMIVVSKQVYYLLDTILKLNTKISGIISVLCCIAIYFTLYYYMNKFSNEKETFSIT